MQTCSEGVGAILQYSTRCHFSCTPFAKLHTKHANGELRLFLVQVMGMYHDDAMQILWICNLSPYDLGGQYAFGGLKLTKPANSLSTWPWMSNSFRRFIKGAFKTINRTLISPPWGSYRRKSAGPYRARTCDIRVISTTL